MTGTFPATIRNDQNWTATAATAATAATVVTAATAATAAKAAGTLNVKRLLTLQSAIPD